MPEKPPTTTDARTQSSCPVDPAARSKWTSLFGFGGSSAPPTPAAGTPPSKAAPAAEESCPVNPAARKVWADLASGGDKPASLPPNRPTSLSRNHRPLSSHREVSSIPRAGEEGSNNEHIGTGHSQVYGAAGGNWIYPSEEMFFAAMQRKAYAANAADMRTIVPIHNAVNERAWMEIQAWERGLGSEKCGGPKLASFSGDSSKLTPRARFKCLMGYAAPFDRHDWTVDRCGTKVDYVIDFYAGKRDPNHPEKVSFYLDVRPKLNSFEGVRMRATKWMEQWV